MIEHAFKSNLSGTDGPLVSIIVPVYNAEKYLTRCLNSILQQTYSNIEVILINDGSSDASDSICDTYANSHDSWSVIHKANGGPAEARNHGLDQAKGEFVYFLDADDYIHGETIAIVMQIASCFGADMVEHNYLKTTEGDLPQTWKLPDTVKLQLFQQPEIIQNTLSNTTCSSAIGGKFVKRSLFKNLRFPCGKSFEDDFTMPLITERAEIYARVYLTLYIYPQHDSSVMHQEFSLHKLDDIDIQKRNLDRYENKYNREIDALLLYNYVTATTRVTEGYRRDLDRKLAKSLKYNLREIKRARRFPKELPRTKLFSYILQCISPRLFWSISKKINLYGEKDAKQALDY